MPYGGRFMLVPSLALGIYLSTVLGTKFQSSPRDSVAGMLVVTGAGIYSLVFYLVVILWLAALPGLRVKWLELLYIWKPKGSGRSYVIIQLCEWLWKLWPELYCHTVLSIIL